jgi:2-oxoglutarate ferredoxin oxidoreductase subunit gamma
MPIRILLAGEGGQGVQTIAKVLAQAATQSGRKSTYIPQFGVEQRGSVTLAFLQIGARPIPYPRFERADVLVVLCNRAIDAVEKYLTDNTLFIYDNTAINDQYLNKVRTKIKKYLGVPAQKIAQEKYTIKAINMIMTGALAAQLKDLNFQEIEKAITKELAAKIAKDPKIKELNFAALSEGLHIAEAFNQENEELKGSETKEITQKFEDDKKIWVRFPDYCKGCGLCIERCPVQALRFSKDLGFLGNPVPEIDINKCIACGLCEQTCPDGAVKLEKKQ